ncbi:hypothetical protein [Agarivorans sp. Toyoura001]|uniref:hypothetical protein n=1 Tax=unclassified Agarivorans TaxID=2636026 RepID=UPI0010E378E0|nr:hypothetical protein [Agarivorans sp. Toyoura001]GDY26242.1 hypothetical protein AHAT_21320 [Agarivorans sp. Toyoura001]
MQTVLIEHFIRSFSYDEFITLLVPDIERQRPKEMYFQYLGQDKKVTLKHLMWHTYTLIDSIQSFGYVNFTMDSVKYSVNKDEDSGLNCLALLHEKVIRQRLLNFPITEGEHIGFGIVNSVAAYLTEQHAMQKQLARVVSFWIIIALFHFQEQLLLKSLPN